MESRFVADTGPLIALAKIDRLDLARHVLGGLVIPPQVRRELLIHASFESARIAIAVRDCIYTRPPEFPIDMLALATAGLDAGEFQVIWLAYQGQAPLLIYEAKGRLVAKGLGLSVVGTAGVLLEAKRMRLIDFVLPCLEEMRLHNYHLSSRFMRIVADAAGEPFIR